MDSIIHFEDLNTENIELFKDGDFPILAIKKLMNAYKEKCIGVLAYVGDKPAGYGLVLLKGTKESPFKIKNIDAYINRVFVFEGFRGMRLASSIISHLMDVLYEKGIKESTLAVRTNSFSAIKAYKYIGFEIVDKKVYITFIRIIKFPHYNL